MLKSYNKIVKEILINNTINYNSYKNNKLHLNIKSDFNTFNTEKSTKLTALFNLSSILATQKAHLNKINFYHKKKKILKKFSLSINLNKRSIFNLVNYLLNFYFYFYDIFYMNGLHSKDLGTAFTILIDNYQLFLKNSNLSQRTQLKVSFLTRGSSEFFKKYLNNLFLINF